MSKNIGRYQSSCPFLRNCMESAEYDVDIHFLHSCHLFSISNIFICSKGRVQLSPANIMWWPHKNVLLIIIILDINECQQGSDRCHQHATCSNTIGSYACTCNRGYQGNGFTCVGKLVKHCTYGVTKSKNDFYVY